MNFLSKILTLTTSLLIVLATASPTVSPPSIQPRTPNYDNNAILKAGQIAARKSIAENYSIGPTSIFWLVASFAGIRPLPRAGFLMLGMDLFMINSPDYVPTLDSNALLWQQSAEAARSGALALSLDPSLATDHARNPVLGEVRVEGYLQSGKMLAQLLGRGDFVAAEGETLRDVFMRRVRSLPDFRALGDGVGEGH